MWQEMTQDAASAATASPSLWRNRPYVLLMSGKTRPADHLSRTDSSGLSSTAAATTASPRQPGRPRHPLRPTYNSGGRDGGTAGLGGPLGPLGGQPDAGQFLQQARSHATSAPSPRETLW